MHGVEYLYLLFLRPSISSASVDIIRQFIVQIPSMDVVFMGYWVTDQV